MIIDGLKFTETQSGNKSVVSFQRTIFENLKPIINAFKVDVIHDITFDGDDTVYKMYTDPMTFSKSKSGYTISFILTDVPLKDIQAKAYEETLPLVKQYLQVADTATVYKYIAYLDKWASGVKYTKDMRISYNNVVYVVLSEHVADISKTPDKTVALYAIVAKDGTKPKPAYQEYVNGKEYNKGDIVTYQGSLYECTWDNNVREPTGLGWKKI